MTKADLIDEVSRLAELTRKDSEVIVETIFESVVSSLRAGVIGVGLAVGLLFMWPFIDAAIRRRWPKSELSMVFGAMGLIVFLAFTLWEALV